MSQQRIDFERYQKKLHAVPHVRHVGRVAHVAGLVIESHGPAVPIGDLCYISNWITPKRWCRLKWWDLRGKDTPHAYR